MLWIKALHIVFVVTWFAGLFYLPRLFVYHADCDDEAGSARLKVMERRLYAIMSLGGTLAALFGLWLLFGWHWPPVEAWLKVKLALVALLIAYHLYCGHLVAAFARGANRHSARFYRWFNELPAVLLIAVVILAVVRPF